MKRFIATLAAASVLGAAGIALAATGPAIDWDPAYAWQVGGSPNNLPAGGELKFVGTVSGFDGPLGGLNPNDPVKEYTFYIYGLISQGTVSQGIPGFTAYTTNYSGGTFELYEGASHNANFAPNPPNAAVPSTFNDGTLLLSGSFTGLVVQSNDFTTFDVGNIEGTINFTGGSLLDLIRTPGGEPCPGLFTGGMTWLPSVLVPGYLYRHDGKIDLQCPTAAQTTTWGKVKTLYR